MYKVGIKSLSPLNYLSLCKLSWFINLCTVDFCCYKSTKLKALANRSRISVDSQSAKIIQVLKLLYTLKNYPKLQFISIKGTKVEWTQTFERQKVLKRKIFADYIAKL